MKIQTLASVSELYHVILLQLLAALERLRKQSRIDKNTDESIALIGVYKVESVFKIWPLSRVQA